MGPQPSGVHPCCHEVSPSSGETRVAVIVETGSSPHTHTHTHTHTHCLSIAGGSHSQATVRDRPLWVLCALLEQLSRCPFTEATACAWLAGGGAGACWLDSRAHDSILSENMH